MYCKCVLGVILLWHLIFFLILVSADSFLAFNDLLKIIYQSTTATGWVVMVMVMLDWTTNVFILSVLLSLSDLVDIEKIFIINYLILSAWEILPGLGTVRGSFRILRAFCESKPEQPPVMRVIPKIEQSKIIRKTKHLGKPGLVESGI